MKKYIVLILAILLFSHCGKSDEMSSPIQGEASHSYQSENNKENDTFIFDISGSIYKKIIDDEECSKGYYFYIKLNNDKLIKWKTTDIKYHNKEVGDGVYFEYLRKDRYSDKAIDH